VGRTCNWEDFPGRGDLIESLKVRSPLERERKTLFWQEKKTEVRRKYDVQIPTWKT
jgi:hypothetical protein